MRLRPRWSFSWRGREGRREGEREGGVDEKHDEIKKKEGGGEGGREGGVAYPQGPVAGDELPSGLLRDLRRDGLGVCDVLREGRREGGREGGEEEGSDAI